LRRISAQPPDDAHVPFARIAEHPERFSIGGAVVGGDSLFDAIELCHRGALRVTLPTTLSRDLSAIGFIATLNPPRAHDP
jgi:hypothetical protein